MRRQTKQQEIGSETGGRVVLTGTLFRPRNRGVALPAGASKEGSRGRTWREPRRLGPRMDEWDERAETRAEAGRRARVRAVEKSMFGGEKGSGFGESVGVLKMGWGCLAVFGRRAKRSRETKEAEGGQGSSGQLASRRAQGGEALAHLVKEGGVGCV